MRDTTWLALTLAAVLCLSAAGDVLADKQEERIARLIEQLGEPDFDKQEEARRQLEKIGEPAETALVAAAGKHADVTIRAKAQVLLTRIYAARVNRLIEKLGDERIKERDAADKELQRLVLAHLRQRGDKDRQAKVEVRLQGEAVKKALIKAGQAAADLEIRKRATLTLHAAYAVRAAELIPLLGDEDFEKRENASREL